jgi:N6-L-threonylcarbamoyladenine synthase
MLILGIETSCDETAASLVEVNPVRNKPLQAAVATPSAERISNGIKNEKIRVLSNVVSSQVKIHAKYGGVVPSLAAREHVKNLPRVLNLALNANRYTLNAIDLITVTAGPGLISSLLVGTAFAKTLAWRFKKPIVGVNHIEGHILSNWLAPAAGSQKSKVKSQNEKPDLNHRNIFPAMCLVVSGGHTQLIFMRGLGNYRIVGETLDDAAGEAFDKIARILGLGYPGGPAISQEAERLRVSGYRLQGKLPRPMINSKNFDFSFAGLKTAVLYLDRDLKKKLGKNKLPKELISQIAAEAQQAIVDVLVSKTIRAAQKYGVKSIMLSGGVSANKLLRSELQRNAERRGIKYFQPSPEYTTDNAAMIALAGYVKKGKRQKSKGKNRKQKVKSPQRSRYATLRGRQKSKVKIEESWKNVKTDANWELG